MCVNLCNLDFPPSLALPPPPSQLMTQLSLTGLDHMVLVFGLREPQEVLAGFAGGEQDPDFSSLK